MSWISEIFHKEKAIIGLCHLKALPSDPGYAEDGGMEAIIKAAEEDVKALISGGIDGIQFTNEFSMPYSVTGRADPAVLCALATIIGRLHEICTVPFGANIIGDPLSSVALCVATGAKWTRGSYHGTWATNEGLQNSDCAAVYRYRYNLRADSLKFIHYVIPENALDIAGRDPLLSIRPHMLSNKPDALGCCGMSAGQPIDLQILRKLKELYPTVPLFALTGVNQANIAEILQTADAVFVGTALKEVGIIENPVSEARVRQLVAAAKIN